MVSVVRQRTEGLGYWREALRVLFTILFVVSFVNVVEAICLIFFLQLLKHKVFLN
jgi:hypothetical protein